MFVRYVIMHFQNDVIFKIIYEYTEVNVPMPVIYVQGHLQLWEILSDIAGHILERSHIRYIFLMINPCCSLQEDPLSKEERKGPTEQRVNIRYCDFQISGTCLCCDVFHTLFE